MTQRHLISRFDVNQSFDFKIEIDRGVSSSKSEEQVVSMDPTTCPLPVSAFNPSAFDQKKIMTLLREGKFGSTELPPGHLD